MANIKVNIVLLTVDFDSRYTLKIEKSNLKRSGIDRSYAHFYLFLDIKKGNRRSLFPVYKPQQHNLLLNLQCAFSLSPLQLVRYSDGGHMGSGAGELTVDNRVLRTAIIFIHIEIANADFQLIGCLIANSQ